MTYDICTYINVIFAESIRTHSSLSHSICVHSLYETDMSLLIIIDVVKLCVCIRIHVCSSPW